MNRKGQVAIYVSFIFVCILIVILAAVFAPMGVRFNTEMYAAGEQIMLDAQQDVEDINDPTVRNQINNTIQEGLNAQENNINVNNAAFQYSWILIILVAGLVVFLLTRRLVAFNQGFV